MIPLCPKIEIVSLDASASITSLRRKQAGMISVRVENAKHNDSVAFQPVK
jgi:hypothetical protein